MTRRFVRGKPLLLVTAAAGLVAGCSSSPGPIDASYVSGNLLVVDAAVPDAGAPDASFVSGNLDSGSLPRDTGPHPDVGADSALDSSTETDADDRGSDGGA